MRHSASRAAGSVILVCVLTGCAVHKEESPESLYEKAEWERRHGSWRVALEEMHRALVQLHGAPHSELYWKLRVSQAELQLSNSPRREFYEQLERESRIEPTDPALRARLLAVIGYTKSMFDSSRQSLEAGLKLMEQAREIASRPGGETSLPRVELMYAAMLRDDRHKAQGMLMDAVQHAQQQGDNFLLVRALVTYGFTLQSQSKFGQAVPWFRRAAALSLIHDFKQSRELALGNMGWCYYRLGDFDQAIDLLSQSQSLASAVGDVDWQLRWLGDIGDIHFSREQYGEAISYFRQASDLARQLGNYEWLAIWLSNQATSELAQGNLDAAERLNNEAIQLQKTQNGSPFEVWPELNAAVIALRRSQFPEAEARYRKVMDLAAARHLPQQLWEAQAGLASVYRQTGRAKEARQEYQATIDNIGAAWAQLNSDDFRVTYFENLIEFYQDYVDFLVTRGEIEKALAVAESSRARVLASKLGVTSSGSLNLAGLRSMARTTHTVFLSYWLAPRSSLLWVISGGQLKLYKLSPGNVIQKMIDQHRKRVLDGEDLLANLEPGSSALYHELVAPARALLAPGTNVVIVPDGALNELNFETLVVDKPAPHYWIEDATISVAPSLDVVRIATMQRLKRPRLLLIGAPVPPEGVVPPLPHLAEEVHAISQQVPASDRDVLTGERACPAAYKQSRPAQFSLIHFAAHAIPNPERPLYSEIILSKDSETYELYAKDILSVPLKAELVTVSACHGAGSKTYAGEGLVGFAWAFLQAGADNVISGLWDVDDSTAPRLMRELYAGVIAHESPAAALRQAKLNLLNSGRSYQRPYFWAPFVDFTRSVEATKNAHPGLPHRLGVVSNSELRAC
jgi:CHAT domain-containing protein